jgi:hypothetical protein
VGSSSRAMRGLCASAEVVCGVPWIAGSVLWGPTKGSTTFILPSTLAICHQFISQTQSVAFLPRIVAASLGFVRLCGVKFWHNVGVCASVEVVLGVPWISGNVLRGFGIGQYDLSSSLLNPAM